jgi:hypothetical protein
MSFVHYTVFDDESEEDVKYSSFVDLESFEESDEETPEGFGGTERGSDLVHLQDDRSHVKPWDPSENFFSLL